MLLHTNNNMEKENWLVYKHTSPSGKVYIGITCRKTTKRWGKGSGYKTQVLFYRAILKYGWHNFKHEILLQGIPEVKAKELEINYIRYYKNLGISYNITEGGDGIVGFKFSKESRIKMSKSHLGQIVIHSEETKLKCRENQPIKRKVVQYTTDNVFIQDFNSLGEAQRITNISKQNIYKCCNMRRNHAGGFIWKYKD